MSAMVNSRYIAAQSKAAIALFLGRNDWWYEAMLELDKSQQASSDIFIDSHDASFAELIVTDVLNNFIAYGDLCIGDGDKLLVNIRVNCDTSPPYSN